MKKIENIAIIGMGALGILYGDFLTHALGKESVGFIANKERIMRYEKEGVTSNGKPCNFRYIDQELVGPPADLIIFAVKATALESAIMDTKHQIGKDTIILSVLNGISSEEIIGQYFGQEHMVHCVAQGMDAVKLGNHFSYSNMGELCIGIIDETESKKQALDAVVELFERTKMPYTLEQDINRRIWCKWMLNVGLNQVIMVHEGNYGTVQSEGTARDQMKAAMREVIAIATAEHVDVTEEDLDAYVKLADSLDPNGLPSMRQDGIAKRPSEVEMFSGTLIKLGKKHRIAVPVNEQLYQQVTEIEKGY